MQFARRPCLCSHPVLGHSARDRLRYLANLIHILTQQQGNPNKIRPRCQFILIPCPTLNFSFIEEISKKHNDTGSCFCPFDFWMD
jgi:hypothetical protein